MRLLPLLLLLACAVEGQPDTVLPPPGPQGMTLSGPSVVYPGVPYTWTVRSPDLAPGVQVDLAWGGAQGPGTCPYQQILGGTLCLDVRSPSRYITSTTSVLDPSTGGGMAVFSLVAPGTSRSTVYLQALSLDGPGSATSTVLPVDIRRATQPCPGSSANLATQADVEAYRGCRTLFSLFVQNGSDITSLDLPALETVTNDIWVSNQSALTRVSLPALTTSGSLRLRDNPALTDVELPALEDVVGTFSVGSQSGSALDVRNNNALVDLYLPSLTGTTGQLYVLDNDALETVDAPAYLASTAFNASVGHGVAVLANDVLQRLSLPSLQTAGDVFVQNNGVLADLDLPALQSTDDKLSIRANTDLETISMPALTAVGEFLLIDNHPLLTSISADLLQTIGDDSFVRDNTVLDTFDLPALTSIGTTIQWQRNPAWCVPQDLAYWTALAGGSVFITDNAGFCP